MKVYNKKDVTFADRKDIIDDNGSKGICCYVVIVHSICTSTWC